LESAVLIPFSALVLASQLLLTVADTVPRFDISRNCRVENTSNYDLSIGLDESTKKCIHDEEVARNQLQRRWSQFTAPDRAMCTQVTTDDAGVPPSYAELLTCLEGQQLEKKK
jgi:hypothetical protein